MWYPKHVIQEQIVTAATITIIKVGVTVINSLTLKVC